MHYHDFHLKGYSVRRFGAEIVLHLLDKYPPRPEEGSHIKFSDVEIYHFLHTGGSIIFGIDEVPLPQMLDQIWDRLLALGHQHGGIDHWDRDDRATYQAKLEAESYKA